MIYENSEPPKGRFSPRALPGLRDQSTMAGYGLLRTTGAKAMQQHGAELPPSPAHRLVSFDPNNASQRRTRVTSRLQLQQQRQYLGVEELDTERPRTGQIVPLASLWETTAQSQQRSGAGDFSLPGYGSKRTQNMLTAVRAGEPSEKGRPSPSPVGGVKRFNDIYGRDTHRSVHPASSFNHNKAATPFTDFVPEPYHQPTHHKWNQEVREMLGAPSTVSPYPEGPAVPSRFDSDLLQTNHTRTTSSAPAAMEGSSPEKPVAAAPSEFYRTTAQVAFDTSGRQFNSHHKPTSFHGKRSQFTQRYLDIGFLPHHGLNF